ncbi:sterol desaturase family protein [Flavihumibacter profundi]|uniref:sterol desaturase family protein n=1 Tax=Flavihumibacter profundi TaxID=2716883 RepID=UPI001CC71BEC|nr:sterol desaturase family protein [Flavihumibacter profundi]MBZ5856184.1 sterol desaturase family protein [Flavihumibacter profundi]
MQINWIAFVVPVFAGLIWLEFMLGQKRKESLHHFGESVANINVGIAERLTDIYVAGFFYVIFNWIYQHLAIYKMPQNFLTWIVLFLLTDFIWYWYHRFGHTINLFWSAHVVHHQSEDFNYTTSVRITIFQAIARGLFWCILPLAGFSPALITVLLMVHGAYPFFTHTQLVGKLGWLEKFLVTPSHHRVHHSSNPEYLDKNYGDVLIIWDKLFGTFAMEREKPVYGLTSPLKSYSFLWQHFHFMLEIFVACKRAIGWKNKLKVIFGKPDHLDPRIRTCLEYKLLSRNHAVAISKSLQLFIGVQTAFTMVILFIVLLFKAYISPIVFLLVALFILVSVIYTGAMLERKTWVFYLELLRIILIGALTYKMMPSTTLLYTYFFAFGTGIIFYRSIYQQYKRYLLGYTNFSSRGRVVR